MITTNIVISDSTNSSISLNFGFTNDPTNDLTSATNRETEASFYAAFASIDATNPTNHLSKLIYSRYSNNNQTGSYDIGLVIKPAINSYTNLIGGVPFAMLTATITEKDLKNTYSELKLMLRSNKEHTIIDFLNFENGNNSFFISEFINKNYFIRAIPFDQIRNDQDDLEGAIGPGTFINYKTETTTIIRDSYNKTHKTIRRNYIK